MSRDEYDPNCEGCQPVIIDPVNGRIIPDSSIGMRQVLKWWHTVPMMERIAWHRVTCHNSRVPLELALAKQLVAQMMDIYAAAEVKQ